MIQSIRLQNWKSHPDSKLEFRKGTNVLVGVMGSGKSSIVDGICFGLFGTFPALFSKRIFGTGESGFIFFKAYFLGLRFLTRWLFKRFLALRALILLETLMSLTFFFAGLAATTSFSSTLG